jgi:hypothetical protein
MRNPFPVLLRDRVAGRVALAAGAVMASAGAVQATRPDIQPDRVETVVEHTILVQLAALLILAIPAVIAIGRRAGSALGRRAAAVAVAGQVALAVTCTVSNVNGGDPDWFVVAAPASNLLWAGGWVALALALHRSGAAHRWVAIGLPLTWIALLPLSSLGGGLLAGGYWLALGAAMAVGSLGRRPEGSPAPLAVRQRA